jgi:hypothetical protein
VAQAEAKDIRTYTSDDKRDYNQIVEDDNGKRIMEVIVEYIGKQPEEPAKTNTIKKAKNNDLDFYNISFRNISNTTIIIDKVETFWEKGKYVEGGNRRAKTSKQIKDRLGVNVLNPNEKVIRKNSWCRSKNYSYNTLHRVYTIIHDTQKISVDIINKYQKNS